MAHFGGVDRVRSLLVVEPLQHVGAREEGVMAVEVGPEEQRHRGDREDDGPPVVACTGRPLPCRVLRPPM